MKKIGIIGGGASGVLAALHLQKTLGKKVKIFIFDPTEELGRGKAYIASGTDYILNIPAKDMYIYQDGSGDFEKWVLAHYPALQQSRHWPFVPRQYFGSYLNEQIKSQQNDNILHIQSTVTAVSQVRQLYRVQLFNGAQECVDYLIVATGYETAPSVPSALCNYLHSDAVAQLPVDHFSGHVVIVGTGLTAIDVWRRLRQNPDLKITLISRHGLLPQSRNMIDTKIKLPNFCGMSPLQIFQILRSLQKNSSLSWTSLANNMRPQIQKIWTSWVDKERSIFIRYLKPYWEVIRHQMPPSVFEDIENDIAAGGTILRAGKICRVEQLLQANFVISAIGSPIDLNLFKTEKFVGIEKCPYGFGFRNKSAPRLWFMGPPAKAVYWEITAVPDIREQAQLIANEIAGDVKRASQSIRLEYFLTHPKSAGESYLLHLHTSFSFCIVLLKLVFCSFVHTIFPFLYCDSTSARIRELSYVLTKRRQRVTTVQQKGQTNKTTLMPDDLVLEKRISA